MSDIMDKYESDLRVLTGEASDKEIQEHNQRAKHYEIVRQIVLQHKNHGKDPEKDPMLKDFHFTPGHAFYDMSIYEGAKMLIEMDLSDARELKFDDHELRKSNPPETDKEKVNISELWSADLATIKGEKDG